MRFLILSDLHANWEALEAVLAEADGKFDRIVCCGDLVGYGADPDRVTEWVRKNVPVVVRGNHDRACAGMENLEWFNPIARAAAMWTQEALKAENLQYLRELEKGPIEVDGFALVHGSPLDEDEYVTSILEALPLWPYLPAQRTFFGHTHIQGGFEFVHKHVRPMLNGRQRRSQVPLTPDGWYLINPGSVGQPRDGDNRAAWLLYDSDERLLSYQRTIYDVACAQRKIVAAGLPSVLAIRLAVGE